MANQRHIRIARLENLRVAAATPHKAGILTIEHVAELGRALVSVIAGLYSGEPLVMYVVYARDITQLRVEVANG